MEFGPILRSLLNNRTRLWLILIEVALTLAIVVNCTSIFIDKQQSFRAPTGMDVENILAITTEPFGDDFTSEGFVENVSTLDLEMLRSHNSVIDATPSHFFPLSGSGSSTSRKKTGSEIDTTPVCYFTVDEHAINTLGVKLVSGRNFDHAEVEAARDNNDAPVNVIVTKAFADRVFPDGDAIGSQLSNRQNEVQETIIGVIDRMTGPWPNSSVADRTMLKPGNTADQREMNYLVRARPGTLDVLYTELEELLVSIEKDRIVTVRTLSEIRLRYFRRTLMAMKIWAAVVVLMIIVTSLGIVGLTSFSVTQRTREIGTRRALGATRWAILRHFLLENWLMTTIGLALGVVLTIMLNFALTEYSDAPKIDWVLIAGGAFVLWAAGLLAALTPALRATTVTPEIATRSV